jgi:hypothetical protein
MTGATVKNMIGTVKAHVCKQEKQVPLWRPSQTWSLKADHAAKSPLALHEVPAGLA